MGQTLTNGVYLPDEGERNCYTGLAGNWRALDAHLGNANIHVTYEDKEAWNNHIADTVKHVTAADKETWNGKADNSALTAHTGDTTIHVTAEDKEAWNGKADNSALTAHTGDTTIHVTAEDKQAWNGKADSSALTAHTGDTTIHVTAADKEAWNGKANDSGVVHKSGAESIAGLKTFTDLLSIDGDYLGTEASTNLRTNICLRSNRDTADKSGAYITRFRQNRTQGGLLTGDLQMFGIDFLENEVRTSGILSLQATGWENSAPTRVDIVSGVDNYSFGTSTKPCMINGISPGALSLPDLTAGVDISAYITDLTGAPNINKFTPTADGWISIGLSNADFIEIYIPSSLMGGSFTKSTVNNYGQAFMPVVANKEVRIALKGNTIGWAKFYPCQGNV